MSPIPLSLYIHFPWCAKKCPYCDFNSHPVRDKIPQKLYIDALIKDFNQQVEHIDNRPIETIFIGGGTPSLISPAEIERLLDVIFASARLKPGAEITLEANPGSLDEAHFDAYLQAGVNRLSIGVQSFNDESLLKIGRIHSAVEAKNAIARAINAGFKNINLDIMFGLPEQSLVDAHFDIEQAITNKVSHLSVYQLTLEPNTPFMTQPPDLPSAENAWEMQLQAQQLLDNAGYAQYEVSAYSRDAPCQHNLNYWQFGDYLAIGAGAHGKLSKMDQGVLNIKRFWNHRHPKHYLQVSKDGQFAAETKDVIGQDRDFEYLMNVLRLKKGFSLDQYQHRTGGDITKLIEKLHRFLHQRWLTQQGDFIRPTELGYRYIDSILLACLPENTKPARS